MQGTLAGTQGPETKISHVNAECLIYSSSQICNFQDDKRHCIHRVDLTSKLFNDCNLMTIQLKTGASARGTSLPLYW